MSLFAGAEVAAAVAEAERVATRRSVVGCDGLKVPVVMAGGQPVVDRVWLDFLEADADAAEPERTVRFLPRVVVAKVDQAVWTSELAPDATRRGLQAAPTIDLTRFGSWEDAEAWFCRARSKHLKTLERLRRKAGRELGPVRFEPKDRDLAAFEQLLTWKRAHYARTGVGDPLAVPANIGMIRALHRCGTLELCTLRAGDRLMAAIGLVRQGGRTYYWMPSYDTELATLSPGNLVLVDSIRHAYDAGEVEYDFMIGDEPYKFTYATDTRLVGAVGTVPVTHRARRVAGRAKRRILSATSPDARS